MSDDDAYEARLDVAARLDFARAPDVCLTCGVDRAARLFRLIDALAEARIERDTLREKLRRVEGALRDVDRVAEAAREVARRAEAVLYGEEPGEVPPLAHRVHTAPTSQREFDARIDAIMEAGAQRLADMAAVRDGHTPTLPPRDDGRGPT